MSHIISDIKLISYQKYAVGIGITQLKKNLKLDGNQQGTSDLTMIVTRKIQKALVCQQRFLRMSLFSKQVFDPF